MRPGAFGAEACVDSLASAAYAAHIRRPPAAVH